MLPRLTLSTKWVGASSWTLSCSVQEGVVQSEVADGDDEGEDRIGCCDGAKVFGYEDLIEQQEDREVDDSRRIGAAEGLYCAAGYALDGGFFSWWFFHGICTGSARLQ